MKSGTLGRSTSPAEVTNVSAHGFWLIVDEQELFVAFKQFSWFRDASIRTITDVQLLEPAAEIVERARQGTVDAHQRETDSYRGPSLGRAHRAS